MTAKNPHVTRSVKLVCRLKESVVTAEGDFIPANTPVEVYGWSEVDSESIEVKSSVYMYADSIDYDSGFTAVSQGLFIAVKPENLIYEKHFERRS